MHFGQAGGEQLFEGWERADDERNDRKLHIEREANLADEEEPMQKIWIGLTGTYRCVT
jgi:hypothetical protein